MSQTLLLRNSPRTCTQSNRCWWLGCDYCTLLFDRRDFAYSRKQRNVNCWHLWRGEKMKIYFFILKVRWDVIRRAKSYTCHFTWWIWGLNYPWIVKCRPKLKEIFHWVPILFETSLRHSQNRVETLYLRQADSRPRDIPWNIYYKSILFLWAKVRWGFQSLEPRSW